MFVDKVQVTVQAGRGGNGVVSFRHEKFVDKGGPDGGDGGHGGNVILRGSGNHNTLANFRYQKLLRAEDGQSGSKRRRHGKAGNDQVIEVPVGTVISDDGNVIADITANGQEVIVAQGGEGGFGNAHFSSSVRQTPRVAEKGVAGQRLELTLELKMIADVGLVGLPNAGKSTFLAAVSNAKPEIADYPFTTLQPNLGVVDIGAQGLLIADIPGLIEGASQGKGLGDEFLRHVERTAVLLHLIDVYIDDVAAAYQTIQAELKSYSTDLSRRPQLVALTKIEGFEAEALQAKLAELKQVVKRGTPVMAISSQAGIGIKEVLKKIQELATKQAAKKSTKPEIPVITLKEDDTWHVTKTDDGYLVSGAKIERFAARTDFDNFHAVQRLRDIMQKMGIAKELIKQGAEPEDQIIIGTHGQLPF